MLHQISRAGFLKYVPLVLSAFLFVQVAAFAQRDTGSLSGTVKDQNGALVLAATVNAKNQRTGEERTAPTNTDGSFSIRALKASAYTGTATNTGLCATVKDIEVNVGRETNLNIGMKLADLTAATVNIISSEEATVT